MSSIVTVNIFQDVNGSFKADPDPAHVTEDDTLLSFRLDDALWQSGYMFAPIDSIKMETAHPQFIGSWTTYDGMASLVDLRSVTGPEEYPYTVMLIDPYGVAKRIRFTRISSDGGNPIEFDPAIINDL